MSVARVEAATPDKVQASLAKAIEFLYSKQKDGHWEPVPPAAPGKKPNTHTEAQYTGTTALVLLALLNSGESANDPRIKQAIDFVLKNPTQGTYALGIRCQLWLALPQTPQIRAQMQKDLQILLTSFRRTGNARGMYDYINLDPNGKSYSHSRSQYAVLGVWAAAQMGAEVPNQYWQLVEEAWKRNQDPSGGWTYMHPSDTKHPVTPGMTTVGVASLFIVEEQLRGNAGINCRPAPANTAIEKGIKWLGQNMDKFATTKSYPRDFPPATLYAYERVGAASGLRYFGGIDWYEKGSDFAIAKQGKDGSWPSASAIPQVPSTAFYMLFLAKGRAPIVFSKLQYASSDGKDGKWDQRSRDVANVTRWIGRLLERELAFQITDLDAPLEDLASAPVTIISGSEPVQLSDKHRDKLKAYIEAGGMLVANADCGQAAFSQSIKKLASEMFPDYEFKQLPANDIILTDYYPAQKWRTKPSVEVLTNGSRKLIVLIPTADPAKAWQLQDHRSKPELFELAANILLYGVDRQGLRYRGDQIAYLPDDPKAKPSQTITVGRVKYPGWWDPEPGGWRRLNNWLIKTKKVGVDAKPVELGAGKLGDVKIAHLTGVAPTKFSDAHREELKKFVEGGGTLIIDAAGGNAEFAGAIEAELNKMFPDNAPNPIPSEHAIFGGNPTVEYRGYARRTVGRIDTPRLLGITLNGRLAVIYSREDLSTGLVGQPVDGIIGYTPDTATRLMSGILTHAAGIKPAGNKPAEKKEDDKKKSDEKKPADEKKAK